MLRAFFTILPAAVRRDPPPAILDQRRHGGGAPQPLQRTGGLVLRARQLGGSTRRPPPRHSSSHAAAPVAADLGRATMRAKGQALLHGPDLSTWVGSRLAARCQPVTPSEERTFGSEWVHLIG